MILNSFYARGAYWQRISWRYNQRPPNGFPQCYRSGKTFKILQAYRKRSP